MEDDFSIVKQSNTEYLVDICMGQRPSDDDIYVDHAIYDSEQRLTVVEKISRKEYIHMLRRSDEQSLGLVYTVMSATYCAPDEQPVEESYHMRNYRQAPGKVIRWRMTCDAEDPLPATLVFYVFHRDASGNMRKIPVEDIKLELTLTGGIHRTEIEVRVHTGDDLPLPCGRYYMALQLFRSKRELMGETLILALNIVPSRGKIIPVKPTMVGMEQIEQQMAAVAKQKLFNDRRAAMNMSAMPINLHAAVVGGKGTGKSTFAKMLFEFYKKNSLIGDGSLRIIDASEWLNPGEETGEIDADVTRARGGMLFIENAAAMIAPDTRGNKDYAVQALVRQLRDNTHNTTVVLADTEEKMTELLSIYDLQSFIGQTYHLPTLTPEQMLQVAENACRNMHVTLSSAAKAALQTRLSSQPDATAQDVENLISTMIMNMASRVVNAATDLFDNPEVLSLLRAEDLPQPVITRYEQSIDKLNRLVGLNDLKYTIEKHLNLVRFIQLRNRNGLSGQLPPLHSVFVGNPGTGKTTVAGLLGDIYASLGLLKTGKVIKMDRKQIIGKYIGDTEANMTHLLQQAHGNILFIDEAYNLFTDSDDKRDFGQKALDCLLEELGKEHTDMIIILAGYTDEMNRMLNSNKGLKSRFPFTFEFKDYSEQELLQIAVNTARESGYTFTDEALQRLDKLIHKEVERAATHDRKHFGNARFITRLISTQIIPNMSRRVLSLEGDQQADRQSLSRIIAADIPASAQGADYPVNEALISRSLQQLDEMIGLTDVKRTLHDMVTIARSRWQAGEDILDTIPLQWTFTGSTGTGKSSVARILAALLHAFGLINSERMTQLRMPQTATNNWSAYEIDKLLRDTMKQAGQGLLFIDLDDVANQHIDIQWLRCKLTSLTAEMPGSYAFVIAVDDKRFNAQPIDMPLSTSVIQFADYTADELMAILTQRLSKHGYCLTDEASNLLSGHIARLCRNKSSGYANARTMRHIFTAITSAAELRLVRTQRTDTPVAITREDVDSFPWNPLPANRIGYDA